MNHNQKIGKFGEDLACQYLKGKGYKIVDRNVKNSYQEIDIVAKIKNKIVFCEVKTRAVFTMGLAEDNISRQKIKNLKKAMKIYLSKQKHDENMAQIDFLAINLDKDNKTAKIRHYMDVY